jgi:hypothetical protein
MPQARVTAVGVDPVPMFYVDRAARPGACLSVCLSGGLRMPRATSERARKSEDPGTQSSAVRAKRPGCRSTVVARRHRCTYFAPSSRRATIARCVGPVLVWTRAAALGYGGWACALAALPTRRIAEELVVALAEMRRRGKAAGQGDVDDRQIGLQQKLAATLPRRADVTKLHPDTRR